MIKVDTTRLRYLVEVRHTTSARPYYILTCSSGNFRFMSLDSLLDFVKSNDFGYIQDK